MTDKDAGEVTGFIRQIDVFDGVTAADYDAAVGRRPHHPHRARPAGGLPQPSRLAAGQSRRLAPGCP